MRSALPRFRKRRYSPLALIALARTAVGRRQLVRGLGWLAWPLAWLAASAYRRLALRRTTLVAVVGSYGKTTTTRAVAAALGLPPRTNVNYRSFLAWSLLRLPPRGRVAVLEVGISRRGQMAGYARMLRPDVVVVTSIGSEHSVVLGTLETTRQEKARMVEALSPRGLAILNGDDENVRWMASRTTARVVRCGLGAGNEVTATEVTLDWPRGSRLDVTAPGLRPPELRLSLRLRLVGEPMMRAALAAAAAALELGVPAALIAERLEELPPTPGRLEAVSLQGGAWLLRDDIKSGVETFAPALELLAAVPAHRRVAVLGEVTEPGVQGPQYRQLGGRVATCDRVLFVGNRRTYEPLRAGFKEAGGDPAAIQRCQSVEEVAALLRSELGAGDVVLVKGRHAQKLERITLLLAGMQVRCVIPTCLAIGQPCVTCGMRERGWEGRRVAT